MDTTSSASLPSGLTARTEALSPAGWWADAPLESVWRVCHLLRGECKRCPAEEAIGGEEGCTRGCYLQAVECVNTVQTGNPWRKTGDVRAPWVVLAPTPESGQ